MNLQVQKAPCELRTEGVDMTSISTDSVLLYAAQRCKQGRDEAHQIMDMASEFQRLCDEYSSDAHASTLAAIYCIFVAGYMQGVHDCTGEGQAEERHA